MYLKKTSKIKLIISSGKANPSPPVGPILGQAGLNMMEFCKDFNKKSSIYKENVVLSVHINVYENKSFDYVIKTPFSTSFIKTMINLNQNKKLQYPCISLKQIYEIAYYKQKNTGMRYIPLKSICSMLIGTAKSMNIKVIAK